MAEPTKGRPGDGTNRAFFAGALLGGLLGAIVALWRAQRSGRDTRELILGRGQKLIDDIEQAADQVRRKIEGDPIAESLAEGKTEARRLNARSGSDPENNPDR